MARIGLDIDGVAYRFVDTLRTYIHGKTGKPLEEMPPATTWDFFEDQWGITADEYVEFVVQGVKDKVIFWTGEIEQDVVKAVESLRNLGHEIVFITARKFKGIEDLCVLATEYWLNSNGVYYDEVIVSNDKTGHNLDILLDDSPAQIQNQVVHGGHAVVFNQPWNADMPHRERVYSWKDFVLYVASTFESPNFSAESSV